MAYPISEHKAIYDLIDIKTNQLAAQISREFEQLRSTVVAEAADLKTAIDNIEASIAHEIQQLADAVSSATELADLKTAVNQSVARLTVLDSSLKADDPVVEPPTP